MTFVILSKIPKKQISKFFLSSRGTWRITRPTFSRQASYNLSLKNKKCLAGVLLFCDFQDKLSFFRKKWIFRKNIDTKRRAIKFHTNQYMCTIHPKWSILAENRLVDTLGILYTFLAEKKFCSIFSNDNFFV